MNRRDADNRRRAADVAVVPRERVSAAALCKYCNVSIRGRRRNGFCSDRCRMAAARERVAASRKALLADLRRVFEAVERELLGGSGDAPDETDGER